jgi:hypothetical protein
MLPSGDIPKKARVARSTTTDRMARIRIKRGFPGPESEEDNVEALALDADTSSDERDAEAAVSAYITTRREVDR